MPPEDNVVTTPGEPGTPELTPMADDNNSNSGGHHRFVLPPTAPKGKPKAPPLIRGKIKPNESEGEMSSTNGSKIPLLKTKHLETDNPSESRKHGSSVFPGTHSGRSVKVENKLIKSTVEVHRTVEKVRLPKGIEMRRVVQESNGIKTKRYSSAIANTNACSTLHSAKESSQGSSNGTHRRKMTKTEASFPEVKSFTGHIHATSSGSSLTSKPKGNEAGNSQLPENNRKTLLAEASKTTHGGVGEVTISSTEISKPEEEAPAIDFKTVDEFLKMPETSIPEIKSRSPVKKTVYKSKFWEYIDPKTSTNSKKSIKETKKNYNPDAVKTFMQKQKETRKNQQVQEAKKKETEVAKRQQMLKELNSKCQKIALKGKQRNSSGEGTEGVVNSTPNVEDIAKKPKLEVQSQSPSMKYLKPLLDRKQGSLLRKSDSYSRDVAKQSQYLLSEFENIVKRECISFLQKIPMPPSQVNIDSTQSIEKVDKAVATSVSLLDLNLNSADSEQKQRPNGDEDVMECESLEYDDSKDAKYPSPSTVEKAVTKIQALYRGYKVRQAFKEANIVFRKPIYKKRCSEFLHQNTTNQSNQTNPSRRWSFPRMPEKPYDNLSRLLPMSPIPMTGVSANSFIPCYIPPPTAAGSAHRSPSRPRVLPSFPPTPNRVYDEPYPKQTRKSIESLDRVNANINLPSTAQSQEPFQCIHQRKGTSMENCSFGLPNFQAARSFQGTTSRNLGPREFDFAIPSSIPSIVDVLREKLRLFSKENDGLPLPNAVARVSELQDKDTSKESMKKNSSEDWRGQKIIGKESGDVSATTNDDQTTPDHEDGVTPKVKKHRRRSRPRPQRSPIADSTTTVDTDADYVPSISRSAMSITERQKMANQSSTNTSKSEELIRSSSMDNPTTTSSFANFLAPALQLRYEAEKEHLKIIERALQVRLQGNLPNTKCTESVPLNNEHNQQSGNREMPSKKSSPETDRVQLAIANCQKESMKAAAEMTKWMSEFQKTTREQERAQIQQTPVNLAATVIAAVEQARIIGIEKRKAKKIQEQQSRQKFREHEHANVQTRMSSESESQSSEVKSKADKSVETSLILVKNFKQDLVEREQRICTENARDIRSLKDYQQQFPSESERDSPLPVVVPDSGDRFDDDGTEQSEIIEYNSSQIIEENADPELELEESIHTENKEGSKSGLEVLKVLLGEVPLKPPPSFTPPLTGAGEIDSPTSEAKVPSLEITSQHSSFEEDENTSIKEDNSSAGDKDEVSLKPPPSHALPLTGTKEVDSPTSEAKVPSLEISSQQNSFEEDENDNISIKVETSLAGEKDHEYHTSSTEQVVSQLPELSEKSEFEDDVSDKSQILDETFEKMEGDISELSKIETESIHTENKEDSKSGSEILKGPLDKVPLKPPPLYTPALAETGEVNSPSSGTQIPSLEISSQQNSFVEDGNYNASINEDNHSIGDKSHEYHTSSTEQVVIQHTEHNSLPEYSQKSFEEDKNNISVKNDNSSAGDKDHEYHTSLAEQVVIQQTEEHSLPELSEKSEFEDDVSEKSQILDETSEKLEGDISELSKIETESIHTENKEELKSGSEVLKLSLGEVHLKPPPPYTLPLAGTGDIDSRTSEAKVPSLEITSQQNSFVEDENDNTSIHEDNNSIGDKNHEYHTSSTEQVVVQHTEHNSFPELSQKSEVENDVSEKPQILDETLEKLEGDISEHSKVEAEFTPTENKEESKSDSEVLKGSLAEVHLKPPPPYTPPLPAATEEVDSPSSEAKVPSLEISSQQKSFEENQNDNISVKEDCSSAGDKDHEYHTSLAEQVVIQQTEEHSLPELSEKSEFEDDVSEKSQILDETSEKLEGDISELSKIETETSKTEVIDPNKCDAETEPSLPHEDAPNNPDFEIPLKPPPPYSPSSSLESTSLSTRSLIVSLPDDRLKTIASKQADIIWDTWKSEVRGTDSFPDKSMIMNALYDQNLVKVAPETNDSNSNGNLQSAAEHNFDVLLCHLIYETMKEVLQVSNNFTSLIERVRPGPLSLHAQKLKIPKTKDSLVAAVITRVMKIIPPAFFSDPQVTERDKPRLRKWCSRPRELVDEILLEELVEEDYQWTEWWPEEVIISHHISTKIIQNLVRSALQKRRYVHSQ